MAGSAVFHSQILGEVGDIESKWTMFLTSIVSAAAHSYGCKVSGGCPGGHPLKPVVDNQSKGCHQVLKGGSWATLARRTPETADVSWQPMRAAAWAVAEAKTQA